MRNGIILAVALTALSASGARADQWCGYASHKDAVVQCGYTTAVRLCNAPSAKAACVSSTRIWRSTRSAPIL